MAAAPLSAWAGRPDQALQILGGEALHLLDAAAARPRPVFDPVLRACETGARPADYARPFADAARRLLFAEDGGARPPWWEAARAAANAESTPSEPTSALRRLLAA